jgi:hypothetical protein
VEKKLTLKKETLKSLSVELLRNVAGGSDPGLLVQPQLASAVSVDGCNLL